MAYTSPNVAPSGATFAQLRSGGFRGQLDRVAKSNALPPGVRSLLAGNLGSIQSGIAHSVDAFLRGDPVSTSELSARLLTYATALKAVLAALEEINTLVDGNPGTLTNLATADPIGRQRRRTFP